LIFLPGIIAFLVGLLLGSYLLFLPLTIVVLLVFVAGALSWCEKTAHFSKRQGLILYACVLAGLGYWLLDARTDQGIDLPFQTGRQEVTLSGVVTAPVEHGPGRMTMIVAVESVEQGTTRREVRGNLRLTWRPCESGGECGPDTDVFRGDRITVRARMRPPFGTRNPGGFDYGAYLRDHGIHAVATVRGPQGIQVQPPGIFDFSEWIWSQIDRGRNQVRHAAISTLRQPARGLFLGMIVGEQNDIPPDVRDDFMTTGTVHIISISGSHLGLLAFVSFLGVRGITRRMPAKWLERLSCILTPRQLAVLVTVPMVLFYTLLSGAHVATVRSLLMILLYLFSVWIGYERQILIALGIAALCTILADPRALYALSFQLSYVSVLAIALVFQWSTSDDGDEIPQAFTDKVKRWGKQYALMTLAATVGTVPLVAYYFNQVAWLGLFANAVVVPFVGMLVVPLGLGASLIVLLGGLEHLPFGWVHQEIMDGLTSVVGMLAMIPGAEWHVASPSILSMAGFYLCFMMALLSRKRTVQVVSVSALIFCLLWWAWSPRHVFEDDALRVTFLDVGQGDATVIELPGGDTILVDGGAAYERWDIGRMVVGPYLWDRGVRRLTHVIATHPQLDHVGGLAWIIDNFEVDHYWSNGIRRAKPFYQRLQNAIARQGLVERIALEGETLVQEGRCRFISLNPPLAENDATLNDFRGSELNNLSVVLSLTCGKHSILLTADAEVEALARLTGHPLVESATLVKIPHHGAKSSLNRQWIQRLNAKTAVVSAGQGNRYGHPAEDVLQAYEPMTIYRTDSHGAIMFSAKPDAGEFRIRRTTDRQPVPLGLNTYSLGREWENLSRFWEIWVRNV